MDYEEFKVRLRMLGGWVYDRPAHSLIYVELPEHGVVRASSRKRTEWDEVLDRVIKRIEGCQYD